jgi:hypothetical protein
MRSLQVVKTIYVGIASKVRYYIFEGLQVVSKEQSPLISNINNKMDDTLSFLKMDHGINKDIWCRKMVEATRSMVGSRRRLRSRKSLIG